MKNKILVSLTCVDTEETYDLFIPINKRVGTVILLLNKAISEMANGKCSDGNNKILYNKDTFEQYNKNMLIRETSIRNGSRLLLM